MSQGVVEKHLCRTVLVLAGAVLLWQTRYLFSYPYPDAKIWFGDESWRMMALESLILTGKPVLQQALGSTLTLGVGLHGCIWIMALIGGVPSIIFRSIADPISIARVVSVLIAIIYLWQCNWLLLRLGIERLWRALFLLALVTTEVFLISSHSARLDILVGTYLLLVLQVGLIFSDRETTSSTFIWIGSIAGAGILIYPHAVTLSIMPICILAWRLQKGPRARGFAIAFITAAVIGGLTALSYYLSIGDVNFHGADTAGFNQFKNVTGSMPILSPLSWQVQYINIFLRLQQWFDNAWPLLFPMVFYVHRGIVTRSWPLHITSHSHRTIVYMAMAIIASTFMFHGPAVFYTIYAVPVFGIVLVYVLLREVEGSLGNNIAIAMLSTLFIVYHGVHLIRDAEPQMRLVDRNAMLVKRAIDTAVRHSDEKPLILADIGAMHLLLHDDRVALMTHHFLWFPLSTKPAETVIKEKEVDLLLQYGSRSYLHKEKLQLGSPILELTGVFNEGNHQFPISPSTNPDTLQLYSVHSRP